MKVLSVLAMVLAGAMALDMSEELADGWRLGLRPRQVGTNLQTFTGALGGVRASAITDSGDPTRPFAVDGDTFPDFPTAATRACDNQHNRCAELSNSKAITNSVNDCDRQNDACKGQISSATDTAFNALVSSNADFDFFCDI